MLANRRSVEFGEAALHAVALFTKVIVQLALSFAASFGKDYGDRHMATTSATVASLSWPLPPVL
jgi:hypothetical protein